MRISYITEYSLKMRLTSHVHSVQSVYMTLAQLSEGLEEEWKLKNELQAQRFLAMAVSKQWKLGVHG